MAVISLCSPKGGVGKTTTAILITSELLSRGYTVTLCDADRQHWATKWAEKKHVSDKLRLVDGTGLELPAYQKLIDKEAKTSSFVIADIEGSMNEMLSLSTGISDLVLIPLARAANYDMEGAVKMFDLIEMNNGMYKKPVNYMAFFNIVGAIRNRFQSQNEEDLQAMGINIMKSRLVERAAYSEYPSFGGLFKDIPTDEVPSLDKAIKNVEEFVDEILENLRHQKLNENQLLQNAS